MMYLLYKTLFIITAHARLMFREIVTVEDAVMAVSVMECSMQVRLQREEVRYVYSEEY